MSARAIEELTLNAWPPLQSLLYDGWVLSFSDGYTRRANSIHPLYPSSLPLADKVTTCESIYAARNQGTVFKITASAETNALDRALETRGYQREALTSVQGADLERVLEMRAAREGAPNAAISLSAELTDAWFTDFNRLTVTPPALQGYERRLLDKIAPAHAFASISVDGRTVAVGLAVAERGHVGLFDIVVESTVRNQGLGRRLCTTLLAWGRHQGAARAYLAVMANNAPARRLYSTLGFRESYTYWYRTQPTT
ncbi:MAG: hypothetical protein NVSMB2_17100 [Chloroflexota bacterium]